MSTATETTFASVSAGEGVTGDALGDMGATATAEVAMKDLSISNFGAAAIGRCHAVPNHTKAPRPVIALPTIRFCI